MFPSKPSNKVWLGGVGWGPGGGRLDWGYELRKSHCLSSWGKIRDILTVIQNSSVKGPCNTLGFWDGNGSTVDVHVLPLHPRLRLGAEDLWPTCHQHLGWPRRDPGVARRLGMAVVRSNGGLLDRHGQVLLVADGLKQEEEHFHSVPRWSPICFSISSRVPKGLVKASPNESHFFFRSLSHSFF